MGGKPRKTPVRRRPSTKCVCGHKKSLHQEGARCEYRKEWWNADKSWYQETICICHEFRSITTHKIITNNEVVPRTNEQTGTETP